MGEDRDANKAHFKALLQRIADAEDNRRKRLLLMEWILTISASLFGVLLIWVATATWGFLSKQFEIWGGGFLVTATVAAAAAEVGRRIRPKEQEIRRQQAADVEAILTSLNDLAVKFENSLDAKSSLSARKQRVRTIMLSLVSGIDARIGSLLSAPSVFD